MKAVIIGATGATGKELLELLMASPEVTEIVALVRKPLPVKHTKLKEQVVDFDRIGEWDEAITADVAFSCMGTTLKAAGSKEAQYKVDYGYQYEFARIAKSKQVPTFILVSSTSANPESSLFYSRMKGELEQAVEALNFKNLIVFRPGPLLRPDSDRAGEKISIAIISFLNKLGLLRKIAPLPVKALAALLFQYAVRSPAGHTIIESAQLLKEAGALAKTK